MSGHRKFGELRQRLQASPEYTRLLEEQHAAQERELVATIQALTTLREARGVTQGEIAQAWESTQSNVSRFEHAQDTSLSTLMRYAAALGGRLELRVVFPDQVVDLTPDNAKPALVARSRAQPKKK
jgi:predicted transcriptional regulator